MHDKRCYGCGVAKPLDEFHRHSKMKDGHINKCKVCYCAYAKQVYRAKSREYAAYERARFKTPHRKQQVKEYQRRYAERYPEKVRARRQLKYAVRTGRIQRKPCAYCGNPKSQGHHHDYSKPLDVTWMCFKCHRERGHGQTVHAGETAPY